jgi:peptidylprolyl isomerase
VLIASTALAVGCKSAPDEPTSRIDPEPTRETAATGTPAANTPTATATPPPAPAPDDLPAPPDVAQAPKDARCTPSHLCSKVVTKGTGKDHPAAADTVKVHYTGWTKEGRMFDSSVKRGEPASFALNQVIKGWTEGVQLMLTGETRRFWIPAVLAYGETPARPGAPAGDLVFDVQLLEIQKAPEPPETPKDLARPPATAKKTKSGLVYRVLKKGTGKDHPTASSTVTVHYSGWTRDGKMFDSSVVRGEPATFSLDQVIKGWTEGVPLMVVGEKTRFWIPADLAYGKVPSRPGAPAGDLVFDVELVAIR